MPTPSGKKEESKESFLVRSGKHWGRAGLAFVSAEEVLADGSRLYAEVKQGITTIGRMDMSDRHKLRGWEYLCLDRRGKSTPIHDMLYAYDLSPNSRAAARTARVKEFQTGVNRGRGEDTWKCKNLLKGWLEQIIKAEVAAEALYQENPSEYNKAVSARRIAVLGEAFSSSSKKTRGFHNEELGRLLCPTSLDFSSPEVRAALQAKDNAQLIGTELPYFVYEDCAYDPKDCWAGAFKGRLLVLAMKAVLTCPSSSQDRPETVSTRNGNAARNGMISMTLPMIAHISAQVRCALCDSSSWSKLDQKWKHRAFYFSVLNLLSHSRNKKYAEELITWYNEQVFHDVAEPANTIEVPQGGGAMAHMMSGLDAKDLYDGAAESRTQQAEPAVQGPRDPARGPEDDRDHTEPRATQPASESSRATPELRQSVEQRQRSLPPSRGPHASALMLSQQQLGKRKEPSEHHEPSGRSQPFVLGESPLVRAEQTNGATSGDNSTQQNQQRRV
ncbi:hypothetical protein PsYK624_064110 [Phanerochaete sordida]|uniref:Uncharacterized protein n=1 Tax=Phanerochaete sordida TaxID=48140 RepID=A0A9P3LDU0_9APHY|nr:hypothetical protein PsYK624_064110 [Phanerochaete sordida]